MRAAPGQSWGRYPRTSQRLQYITDRTAAWPDFDGMALPQGNARSYGDSCLNPGGTLLASANIDRFIRFDQATGELDCEAGVTLAEIIDLVLPYGWFLPSTPGTQFVTIGGAIANDVHGKNHHRIGSFGHHVAGFELIRSDGTRRWCAPGIDDPWFSATVGGLGLTGIITWARLRLRRVPGPNLETENIRFGNLDEFFALSAESAATHEYSVAWIDCLARGNRLGRGHFTRADHAPGIATERPPGRRSTRTVPFTPPLSLVNQLTLAPFNALYYHRQRSARKRALVNYSGFFYPLDAILEWNRIYGPNGFLQHQCVLPPGEARLAIAELLREIAHSGEGSFLAVLKEFGDRQSLGLMSFPRPGTTLALDFPNRGPSTFRLLERLDRIVLAAGGAIYPAKDARMSKAMFETSFPNLARFRQFVDPTLSSGLWRRVTE